MTRRPRRRGPIALALISVVAAAAGWAALHREPADRPAARMPLSPECVDIQGEELARNGRWRVVHTGNGGEFGTDYSATPVIACEVRAKGPARVRLLGMAKHTGGGEDYVLEDGPYVIGGGIGADLVLIDTRFYELLGNEGGSVEKGYTTLFDLRRGASTRLTGDWLQRFSYEGDTLVDHQLHASLSAQDGLTTVGARQDGRDAPTRFGPVTTWDARGVLWRKDAIDRIAPDRVRTGDDGGLYVHRPNGATARIATRGAAITWALRADPKLAWRRMDLAAEPEEEPLPPKSEWLPNTFSLLPLDRFGHGGGIDSALWLRYSPSDRAPDHTVQITQEAGVGRTFARLTRGSDHELHVLGSDGEAAIITGRFEERPQEQRVRLVGYPATPAAQRFFDLPATTALRNHGRALIGDGRYALTDGSTLWIWSGAKGHVRRAKGLHDLQLAIGGDGVFATDARGRARFFS